MSARHDTHDDIGAAPAPTCERLWTTKEVSAFLGVPVATLHQWRHAGTGPAAFRVGRHLRYDPDVVRRWLVEECTGRESA
jgi:predicted site-specific integrase-resolvase